MIKTDKDWIKSKRGFSLNIRTTFISMANQLGLLPPRDAKIFMVMSTVGPYFPTGLNAINITCNENVLRSWPGGFGFAKLGRIIIFYFWIYFRNFCLLIKLNLICNYGLTIE